MADAYYNGASSGSQIDDAVSKRHAHPNLSTLGKLGEADGGLTFNGTPVGEGGAAPPAGAALVIVSSVPSVVPGDPAKIYVVTDANDSGLYWWDGSVEEYRILANNFYTIKTISGGN